MIWGIFIAILTITVDLATDYRKWLKQKPVNHVWGAILRMAGLAPALYLMGWEYTLLVLSVYWFAFDGLYNTLRGFGWWFTGSDDPDDAQTDNLIQQLKQWQHIALKVGLIGAGVALIFIL